MPNEYDAEEERRLEELERGGMRWMSIVVVGLVIVGFISLAWYAYHTSQQSLNPEEAETIKADETAYKRKPENPGGMEIAHQDASVYDMISNSQKNESKIEQLLPETEEPISERPQPQKEEKNIQQWVNNDASSSGNVIPLRPAQTEATTGSSAASDESTSSITNQESEPAESQVPEPQASVQAPADKEMTNESKEKATKPPVSEAPVAKAKAPATPKPVTAKSAPGGKVQVQIAALKSQAEAEATWKSMVKKHPALVGKSHSVVKADLGSKGVYYRLRVTDLASSQAASKLCASLTAKGASCVAVR